MGNRNPDRELKNGSSLAAAVLFVGVCCFVRRIYRGIFCSSDFWSLRRGVYDISDIGRQRFEKRKHEGL